MIDPQASVYAHLYLSLAAVIGFVLLHNNLREQGPDDPLTRRFIFGVRATILVFAGRALVVITGGSFGIIVSIGGALIPLAVLLLTEGLLRRHAPPGIKIFVAAGSTCFLVMACIPAVWSWGVYALGLVLYQVVTLGLCGWLVVRRDRQSLSGAENKTAARLALSLIIIVPMIAADWGMVYLHMPVQVSALGGLILCWLAVGLGQTQGGHRNVIGSFLVLSFFSLGSGAILGWILNGDREAVILGAAVVMAAMLVGAIYVDARQQKAAGQSQSLLRHMAEWQGGSAIAFMSGLRDHPAVSGALLIKAAELTEMDSTVLNTIFERAPILRRTDPLPDDALAADHVTALFQRYDASHILQVSAAPRRLIALSMPALGMTSQTEYELRAVQRMAALIAQNENRNA